MVSGLGDPDYMLDQFYFSLISFFKDSKLR